MPGRIFACALASASLLPAAHAAEGPHWGYRGEHGAGHWAEIDPAFALCGSGRNQSPIDIRAAVDADMPALSFNGTASANTLQNNGHTVQIGFAPERRLQVDGLSFQLLQAHFHAPSENTIDGKHFPMEAHLVHADANGSLAVIGVMFELGDDNPALQSIWRHLPLAAGPAQELNSSFKSEALLPAQHDYYRFNGSLTTPPCSEGVRWFVLKQPLTLSEAQLTAFTGSLSEPNNRPLQPLNARLVLD